MFLIATLLFSENLIFKCYLYDYDGLNVVATRVGIPITDLLPLIASSTDVLTIEVGKKGKPCHGGSDIFWIENRWETSHKHLVNYTQLFYDHVMLAHLYPDGTAQQCTVTLSQLGYDV